MPRVAHKFRPFPMLPVLAFAVALAIATFFMGDIGVYNDDYFCNQRDMATGEPYALVMNRPWHLWRPLTRRVLTPLITLLWPEPWALHLISAGLHALGVGLLYALLRRLGVRAGIAGAIALAFMVYPVHFEAVLWSAIICTLMSVALVLAIWHGYLWWLRASHERAPWVRLAMLIAFAPLAWASAAFNEQPPGALAPLIVAPFIVGAAGGGTARRRLVRTLLPIVSVSIGLGVYLRGFFRFYSETDRAAREAAVGGLPQRMLALGEKIPGEMLLRNFGSGAFRTGIDSIAAHPIRGAVAFGLLALLGLGWVLRREPGPPAPAGQNDDRKYAFMILLGLAWSLCSWLPVAASHIVTSPRLHYISCMGLAIAAAGALSLIAARLRRPDAADHRGMLAVLRFGYGAAIGAALVVWVGIQTGFQRRWIADRAEIEPLVRVFGATLEPDSILLPVHTASRVLTTGSKNFDGYYQTTWFWDFSSGWRVQQDLRRPNVWTVITASGIGTDGLWLSDDDPEHRGVLRARLAIPRPPKTDALFPRTPDHQGRDLPWDRAVLFDVSGAGNCRIYTKIRLHVPGRGPVEIVPRQIAISPMAAALPEYVLDLYPIPPSRRHTRHPETPGTTRRPD